MTPTAADLVIVDCDADLQPIRFAGAPLPFIAPFADSLAIDAMLGPNCPPVDAIGTERPVDGDNDGLSDCDIGAIEFVPGLAPPALIPSVFALAFGEVEPGFSSNPQSIVVSNTGEIELSVGTVALAGVTAVDFEIVNDACSGQSILLAGTCTIDLRFAPDTAGIKSARLQLPSNDPEGTKSVALEGTSGVLFADGFED